MRVVIKVGAGAGDPVDEAGLDGGMMQERPTPAGVSAPERLTPIVTSVCSIFSL